MNKLEIQKRVLKNGKPLDLELFSWDEKQRIFSSEESNLVLDFLGINNCIFKTGSYCIFHTGSSCTFHTWSYCTFKTGVSCTFDTGAFCTFKTGSYCTFHTRSFCTFNTVDSCTFDTGAFCTFETGNKSVIIRRDIFEVIVEKKNIQLCPYGIEGYLYLEKGGWIYSKTGKKSIIVDGILSEILSIKKNENIVIYTVINYGEKEKSYIIQDNDIYSHGKTIKEAKESLIYKISNRDTEKFKSYTLDTVLSFKEQIELYRTITGACESGCRYFVKRKKIAKIDRTIKEIIEITKNQYNNDKLIKFMEKL